MGTADTVFAALVSMAFFAGMFILMDTVAQSSPSAASSTSGGLTGALWIFRPLLPLQWIAIGLAALLGIGVLFGLFRFVTRLFSS